MNLYLLRHALALEKPLWRKADAERPLTDEGRRKMKKAVQGIKKLNLKLDWILTSPYRRAYDTAHLVADGLKMPKKLKISRSLAVDGDPKMLMRHLALDYRSWESLMIVGHEPYLTDLLGTLIGGLNGIAFDLKKGGLCKLTAESLTYGRCATLEWFVTPKILKKLS
jgi:phosphohistidine phosphatase